MRRRQSLRAVRLAHAAVGASVIAGPSVAAALAEAATDRAAAAPPGSGSGLEAELASRRVPYGREVVVRGRAGASEAGQTVSLQFTASASQPWRSVAGAVVGPRGGFRLRAPLRRSGLVRVLGGWQAQPSSTLTAAAAAGDPPATTDATAPARVIVAAALHVRARALEALGPGRFRVTGRLLPALAGRRVRLQLLVGGGWETVARAVTGRRGRFAFAFAAPGSGSRRLRVVFSGDRLNGATRHPAGTVTAFVQSVASWYSDGGATACGFHAYYGVANVSLPCGTRVTFDYHGRTVTATVDDRGPFVAGRRWDLNQNTAAALGFGGVDAVWTSR